MWHSMLNFAAYLQSLTGFSWDKTGLTLYTAYAVLRRSEAYGSSAKLLQTIPFYIQSINNVFFKASENKKNIPFVSSSISVRDTKK